MIFKLISANLLLAIFTNVVSSSSRTNLYVAVDKTATFNFVGSNTSCDTIQFVKSPGNIILTIGDKINNQSAYSFISNRIAISNREDTGSYTVQIKNVSTMDQGQYQFDPGRTQFYLWVVNLQTFPSTTIPEGTHVNLSCISNFSHGNSGHIHWMKNNVEKTSFSPWMVFPNISRNDSGTYACCIKDANTTYKNNVTITVQYPPDVTVNYTDENLTCTASGSPESLSYLYMEHASLFGEHIRYINLSSTDGVSLNGYDDNGRYTCTASNGIGDMNGRLNMTVYKDIFIKDLPVFLPENVVVYHADIGQSQQMDVNVYCHPPCDRISWMIENSTFATLSNKYDIKKKKAQMTTSFHNVKVTVNVQRVRLTIQTLQGTDFNQYSVTAVNTLGTSYFKINLQKRNKAFPVVVWYVVSCLCGTIAIFICRCVYVCCLRGQKQNQRRSPGRKSVQIQSECVGIEVVRNPSVTGRRFVIRESQQQSL